MHWPVPLNPNGNDGFIPKRPDGSRDIDASWDIKDTWKQMEALVKKGQYYLLLLILHSPSPHLIRQNPLHRRLQLLDPHPLLLPPARLYHPRHQPTRTARLQP